MKKFFTLIIAAGMVSIASAQQTKQIIRSNKQVKQTVKVTTMDRGYQNHQSDFRSYSFSAAQKQSEIRRIQREYDQKIAIIQRSRSARTAAMGRKVRQMEQQRDAEIRAVEARYDNQWNNGRAHVIVKNGHSNW